MEIGNEAFVAINYTLKDDDGEVIDSSPADRPLGFIYGRGMIFPALEEKIAGMSDGEQTDFVVEATEGYGERRDELVNELPRDKFPEELDIKEGMVFQAPGPQGPMNFTVVEVRDDAVVADFNHPLAGQRLHFDVTIAEVREATTEEIEALSHGCGHGAHECTHCGEHD